MKNKSADTSLLTAAVKDIAIISHSALSEINSIGKLLLSWLETQEAYRDPETIFRALDNIVYTAQKTIETVGHEAEAVGCDDYIDPNAKRRQIAAAEYSNAIQSEKQRGE